MKAYQYNSALIRGFQALAIFILLLASNGAGLSSTAKADGIVEEVIEGVFLNRDRDRHRDGFNRDRHRRGVFLGEDKIDKIVVQRYRFSGQGIFAHSIILSARKADVDIRSIEIVYQDGYVEDLYASGNLREDIPVRLRIDGGRIRSVIITAVSPSLFGSRGRLSVYAGRGGFWGRR